MLSHMSAATANYNLAAFGMRLFRLVLWPIFEVIKGPRGHARALVGL